MAQCWKSKYSITATFDHRIGFKHIILSDNNFFNVASLHNVYAAFVRD